MRRFFLAFFLGCCLGLWEVAVRPFLPIGLNAYPILPALVVLVMSARVSRALTAAATAGMLVDAFSLPQSDAAMLRYVLVTGMLFFVLRHVVTNRSLVVALALSLLGRAGERLLAWAFGTLSAILLGTGYDWARQPIWWETPVWDLVLSAVGFLLVAFFTRRFLTFIDEPV